MGLFCHQSLSHEPLADELEWVRVLEEMDRLQEELVLASKKAAAQDALISSLRKEIYARDTPKERDDIPRPTFTTHTGSSTTSSRTYTSSPYTAKSNSQRQYQPSYTLSTPQHQAPPVSPTYSTPSGHPAFGIPSAPPNTRRFPQPASPNAHFAQAESPYTFVQSTSHGGLQSFGPACETFIDLYQLGDRLHGELQSLHTNTLMSK